ncbi:MAG: hypothetical protein OXC54_01085 [Rhodospirillaceae bacterium]|nr:hypothetical protein [Rhodospirillaceae bacterium]
MATLATEIRNVSGRRGDMETLLTGVVVEAANLWASDRRTANEELAAALNMQPGGLPPSCSPAAACWTGGLKQSPRRMKRQRACFGPTTG